MNEHLKTVTQTRDDNLTQEIEKIVSKRKYKEDSF